MNLIAAVDKNWAIGKGGRLLVSIPEDQKLFQQETMGKIVVMGRKTLESLPGGKPLYGRKNVVLSQNPAFQKKGAEVFHEIDSVLSYLKQFASEDIFVIGGGAIYRLFLPYCDTAHITRIDYAYEADTFFPNLDEEPQWRVTADSGEHTYFNICYEFVRYEKRKQACACSALME